MARCSLSERNVRLFWKFSKVDLFDLKPNCAHLCQETKEMVWFWLFVTKPFSIMGGQQFSHHVLIYV